MLLNIVVTLRPVYYVKIQAFNNYIAPFKRVSGSRCADSGLSRTGGNAQFCGKILRENEHR